jgi:hypothetical protein
MRAKRPKWPSPSTSSLRGSRNWPDKVCWWEQTFSLGTDSLIWIGAAPGNLAGDRKPRLTERRSRGRRRRNRPRHLSRDLKPGALGFSRRGLRSRAQGSLVQRAAARSPPPSAAVAGYSFDLTFGEAAVPVLAAFNASWSSLSDSAPPEDSRKPIRAAAARPASWRYSNPIPSICCWMWSCRSAFLSDGLRSR